MKIAIVDDSSLDRDFLKNGLEIIFEERNIENLEIQEFSSGEELLNYLRENPSDFFHIIFMDIYMEDLTGVETAKAIRKTDEQVKIVFITTSNEFASESYEVRAEDYLIKPFDGRRMNKIIDRFFRKNKEVKILEFPNGRKVFVNSIVYTSFSGHYVTVFMKEGYNASPKYGKRLTIEYNIISNILKEVIYVSSFSINFLIRKSVYCFFTSPYFLLLIGTNSPSFILNLSSSIPSTCSKLTITPLKLDIS